MGHPFMFESTFTSGPTDAIATVDAYKATTSSVTNAIADATEKLELENLNVIKYGNALNEEDMNAALLSGSDAINGLKVNSEALLKGVVASNAALLSSLKGLPSKLQDTLTKAKGFTNIAVTLGSIQKIVKGADLKTLSGVGSMINSLSGGNFPISFVDKSGLINLSSNLIKEATKLGLPNSFSAMASGITDKKVLNGIVKNLDTYITTSGNTSLLSDIANSSVGQSFAKFNPNFANDFVNNYKKPWGMTAAEAAGDYSKMVDSFGVIDPNWNIARDTGNDVSINANTFKSVSKDFLSIFKDSTKIYNDVTDVIKVFAPGEKARAPVDRYMLLGNSYGKVTALSELKRNFPNVVYRSM